VRLKNNHYLLITPLLFFAASLLATQGTFERHDEGCFKNILSAKKDFYLKAIGDFERCPLPSVSNPTTEWECEKIKKDDCDQEWITCKRSYGCRYLNKSITLEFLKKKIRAGETGDLFKKYSKTPPRKRAAEHNSTPDEVITLKSSDPNDNKELKISSKDLEFLKKQKEETDIELEAIELQKGRTQ